MPNDIVRVPSGGLTGHTRKRLPAPAKTALARRAATRRAAEGGAKRVASRVLRPTGLFTGPVPAGRGAAAGLGGLAEALRGPGAVEAALGGGGRLAGALQGPGAIEAALGGVRQTAGAVAAAGPGGGLLSTLGPFAATVLLPLIGLEGLRHITGLRERKKGLQDVLSEVENPASRERIIRDRLLKERLQENLVAAKLTRMENVARNDPGLFKMLSAMVAGSARPRTTASAIRIGPEPSQMDMLTSGLF